MIATLCVKIFEQVWFIDYGLVTTHKMCSIFLNEVGMIKNGDGSLQDCHKALQHYDKLLVQQNFLVELGIIYQKYLTLL